MDPADGRPIGREHADHRRAEQAAGHDECDDEPVEGDVELVHELVQPLVDEADLDLPVAHLFEHVVHLVRQVARDPGQLAPLPVRARATRRGVKRSSMSARAYGRATSKTLKPG